MGRGGAETWMVQLLDHLDPRRIQVDLMIHQLGGAYEGKVVSHGCRVFSGPMVNKPLVYTASFKKILRENGPYDAVHSHLQLFSGLILKTSATIGIPVRIAHARNSNDGQRWTPYRAVYRTLMRHWINRYATHRFAVSAQAAIGTFGKDVLRNGQCRLLSGMDFAPFRQPVNRNSIRQALGIRQGVKVVGHVGSFRRQKNHAFLLEIARLTCAKDSNLLFLLVGEGPLRKEMEERVRLMGLGSCILFLGERPDVPSILRSLDAFVFPSLYEGLPRVLLEAQAAGLCPLASDVIAPEAAAWPGNIAFLPLHAGPRDWMEYLLSHLGDTPPTGQGARAIKCFEERGLSIDANATILTNLYEGIANSR
jgi:glycosyltransferase involved in cell wall biosynthesis